MSCLSTQAPRQLGDRRAVGQWKLLPFTPETDKTRINAYGAVTRKSPHPVRTQGPTLLFS